MSILLLGAAPRRKDLASSACHRETSHPRGRTRQKHCLSANIRFAASGSAASVLSTGSRESGAGRFTDLKLTQPSFYEYVTMIGRDENLFESMEQANRCFIDYVNFGGYPKLVANRIERDDSRQFIQRDIVDKVLLRDLPSLYHIEDVRDLAAFFSYLAFHSGMVQSYETLSQRAGLSKHTISNFLRYLEDAFLIVRQDRIGINALSLQRATQFKIYLTNTSLRASMFQPVSSADDIYLGYAVETAISAQLGIDASRHVWRYANWKHGKTQGEIDFVAVKEQKKCFIQVAYLLSSEETIKREFGAFEKITDASPKYVLSLDRIDLSHDGIEHLNIVDFLLHKVQLHLS